MENVCEDHVWGPTLYKPLVKSASVSCFSPPVKKDFWIRFCKKCGRVEEFALIDGKWQCTELERWSESKIEETMQAWKEYHEWNTHESRVLNYMDSMYRVTDKKFEMESMYLKDGSIADEGDCFPGMGIFGVYDPSGPFFVFEDRSRISDDLAVYLTQSILEMYHTTGGDLLQKAQNAMQFIIDEVCNLHKQGYINYNSKVNFWSWS